MSDIVWVQYCRCNIAPIDPSTSLLTRVYVGYIAAIVSAGGAITCINVRRPIVAKQRPVVTDRSFKPVATAALRAASATSKMERDQPGIKII